MKRDTKHSRAQIVNKTLNYMYKHIGTDISLEELARLNSVSKYHFHRIFKDETGENVFEKITSIRLQKAANLLITDNYSTITEIANLCGLFLKHHLLKHLRSVLHIHQVNGERSF